MYPTISDLIKDIFGIYIPLPIQSFGFFVAISFIVAAWLVMLELRRKENDGILKAQKKKNLVGKPASISELLIFGIGGFIAGFKIVGVFFNYAAFSDNPAEFIFSSKGNVLGGIVIAVIAGYYRYREKQKHKLPTPKWEEVDVHPYELTGNIILYGAIFGILGSKIFNSLENIDNFIKDPIGDLLSFSGLSFYGGLILAAIVIIRYAGKNKIPLLVICDSCAPAIMIAYAIGRIGCQVAGDGDWGILNSAYITTPESKIELVDQKSFQQQLEKNKTYYFDEFNTNKIEDIPRYSLKAPSFLPVWMFAYQFPHNVIDNGVEIQLNTQTVRKHNSQLPIPVFPTALYETIICSIFFFILWFIRKKILFSGAIFSVFLMMNGIERFFIEKIRVNSKYDIFGMKFTQAELISTLLFIAGTALLIFLLHKKKRNKKSSD